MAGNEEKIEIPITVPGAKEAAKDLDTLGESLKRNAKAANDNAQGLQTFSVGAQRATQVAGQFGSILGRLSPEAQSFGNALGKASGTIGQMTALLGGVTGLATGGLVFVLGLLVDKYKTAKTEAEEFAKAQKELAKEAEKAKKEFTEQRLAIRDAANEWASSAGKSSGVRSIEAAIKDAKAKRDALGPASQSLGNGVVLENQRVAQANAEIARLEQELAAQKAKESKEKYDEYVKSLGNSDYERFQREGDTQKLLDQLSERDRGYDRLGERRDASEWDRAREAIGAGPENKYMAEAEAYKKASEKRLEDRKKEEAELIRMDEAQTKRFDKMRSVGMDTFKAIGASGIQALAAVAQGQKVTLKDILYSLGSQLIGMGTQWLFEGDARVAKSYGLDGSGYTLNAIGGAAVVAGLAMMAGGTAAGSGHGGGGGGGSAASKPAEPTAAQSKVAGAGPTTININQNNLLPDAKAGEAAVRAIEDAKRQGLVA